jgi:NADPH-dependent ferric siderophore reductase
MYGRVEHVEQLTPQLVRVVLGGEGLAGFSAGEFTDHYVKLQFPPPGAPYSVPFDAAAVRELPREQQPVLRTYTVRDWDAGRGLLTLDFVVHGDSGIAGPWARRAKPGDLVALRGPGGAFAPDPTADWHLMVGDESALPAIAASLARVPAGVRVHVVAEVEGPDGELALETPGDLVLTWVHRGAGDEDALLRTVSALEFPPGRVCAFVHGEAVATRALRKHLLGERGVPRADLSVSGYWRRTFTEDGWQSSKREWNQAVERDVPAMS